MGGFHAAGKQGKTIRSTGKMDSYESPLHIVSAQVAELGITYARQAVAGKSNEIPAVRELLGQLEPGGCLVVADALNCQIMFDCLLDPSCICDIIEIDFR